MIGFEIAGDNGGHCAVTGADSVTGNCDDAVITESLAAGQYTLALSVWDNVPGDGFLPDGFQEAGNPGFTCAEFGHSGEFCDVTTAGGTVRNGGHTLAISGDTLAPAPEPSLLALGSFGR